MDTEKMQAIIGAAFTREGAVGSLNEAFDKTLEGRWTPDDVRDLHTHVSKFTLLATEYSAGQAKEFLSSPDGADSDSFHTRGLMGGMTLSAETVKEYNDGEETTKGFTKAFVDLKIADQPEYKKMQGRISALFSDIDINAD